jgi:SAM-dependent methyltransferase
VNALSPETAQWATLSEGFRAAVEAYFRRTGADPDSAPVQSTVKTNTDLVPRRAANILELLRSLGGREGIRGCRVVEAGCGFGALAGYLAWHEAPAQLIAFDIRPDYVESARESARPLDLGDRLRYEVADMRRFDGIEDGFADVAILNNAFIYLPTKAEMRTALGALARVVKPGGHAFFYHANKWTLRDPFSGDPFVHLLPRTAADGVSTMTGWKHNHGRIRLVSPPEMARRLRRAGFDGVGVGGHRQGGLVTGRHAWLASFYGVVARRSG